MKNGPNLCQARSYALSGKDDSTSSEMFLPVQAMTRGVAVRHHYILSYEEPHKAASDIRGLSKRTLLTFCDFYY